MHWYQGALWAAMLAFSACQAAAPADGGQELPATNVVNAFTDLAAAGDASGSETAAVADTAETVAALEIAASAPEVATETAAATDGSPTPDGLCGEPGCACAQNSTCNTGMCIEVGAGKQCATLCASGCPGGFKCAPLTQSGGDIMNVCVPATPRLCEPCTADSDCNNVLGGADNRCVPYADNSGSLLGNYCAVPCGSNEPCPSGYQCKEKISIGGVKSSQCVKSDLVCDCDERAAKLGLSTACSNASLAGTCNGKRACSPAGLSACDAPSAKTEQCNFKDDDCDGLTDEPTPGMCDDGSVCSYDNCIGAECQHPPKAGPCDDGTACTKGDTCSGIDCVGAPVLCDDKNPCTSDGCDLAKGCTTAVLDKAGCSDGNACTVGDSCSNGVCLAGAWTECDDGNACTTDTCSPNNGCVFTQNKLPCSDGDVCTVGDVCSLGVCVTPQKLVCDDGNPCTDNACDPLKACSFKPNTADCSDNNVCTVLDACAEGICQPGFAKICDDGNACTTDSCDPKKGCAQTPNSVTCNDGNPCTQDDSCNNGKCEGIAKKACNDGNPCTTDLCDGANGCVTVSNSDNCSDSNACTEGDQCKGGLCQPGAYKSCDDGNACTDDWCTPDKGCTSANNIAPCSDGSNCTVNDQCAAGKCVSGKDIACDDANPCTDQTCDPKEGCNVLYNTAKCNDNNVCTLNDGCKAGLCFGGTMQNCDDNNWCTDDACSPVKGCTHTANLAPCNDGNSCTINDVCADTVCKAGGTLSCNDGNPCTDDKCGVNGCDYTSNAAKCDDGNPCTGGDACSGGKCAAGKGCDKLATCTPAGNTVTCKCPSGYDGDGFTCTDIDECGYNNGGCNIQAQCTNKPGSFSCACFPGFTGDGFKCADVNECLVNNGGCNNNATCSNTVGSFQCACKVGWYGDGVNCATKCGDGIVAGTEQCDDANNIDNDACSNACVSPIKVNFTFTTCGATGPNGPNQAQCNPVYNNTPGMLATVVGGIQNWTVPIAGNYSIEAFGAQGGNNAGKGARMKGTFTLSAGDVLQIVVGQQGLFQGFGSGGGGGSFVVSKTSGLPLIIAAGGGGAGHLGTVGYAGNAGNTGPDGSPGTYGSPGAGGSNGQGGFSSSSYGGTNNNSGGGAGWFSDGQGQGSVTNPGKSFKNGALGGASTGGFGGGGGGTSTKWDCSTGNGGGSGGGGYSGGGGGGGSCNGDGGGGGSLNNGANPNNTAGANAGDGKVIIIAL